MKFKLLTRGRLAFAIFLTVIIIVAILYFTCFKDYCSLENIKANRSYLRNIVEQHYLFSVVMFIGAYILLTLSSLPVPGIMTIVGGFMYGLIGGIIYSSIAAILASILIFGIVRRFLGNRLQDKHYKRFAKFNNAVTKHGASYLLMIQLTAIFPYFVVAFGAGVTQIPFWTFVWTTALGILPGSYVYAFTGAKLGTIDHWSEIFTPEFYVALTIFAGIIVLALWWRHEFMHKNAE